MLRRMVRAALVAIILSFVAVAEAASQPDALLAGQTVTLLPGNRWLLVGGQGGTGATADVVVENATTGARATMPSLSTARAGHTATVLPDGMVLIVGGIAISGAVLAAPELIDVAAGTTIALDDAGVLPRTDHTATLLTDGRVLIAGGRGGNGDALAAAQLWDFRLQQAQAIGTPLAQPRTEHTATLLADGSVLLWGGRDGAGALIGGGEIFDPQHDSFASVTVPPTAPLSGEAAELAGALPADGADGVGLEPVLALRFSKPLELDSVTPATVSLHGPSNIEPAIVVVAEQGALVFVTPYHSLTPGTQYTLTVSGVADNDGNPAPWSGVHFTTQVRDAGSGHGGGHDAHGALRTEHSHAPAVGPYGGPDETDDEEWRGERRNGKPHSRWQDLPPLHAPDGVTALSGQVLRANGEPLANVTMRIGRRSTLTDDTGRFLLADVSDGYQILLMDGSTANAPGKTYGTFDYGLPLTQAKTTVLPFTVWMPLIDTQHATEIPVPTVREVVATSPRIPGLEIRIPADVILQTQAGPLRSLTLTQIPPDRAPIPTPPGGTFVFTPQAHGALVLRADGTPSPVGVRTILPNYDGVPAGTRVALWSYSAWQGGWFEYGYGTVSADARQIVPDAGVDLKRVTCYFYLGAPATFPGPVPGGIKDGDPVDLATGLFTHEKTDLIVPDVIPIVLKRAHRPGDPNFRQLGSSNFEYQMYLTGDLTNYTWAELILADGGRIRYDRISGSTLYDSVMEHTATPTRFYKSRLAWSTEIPLGGWAITFTDGIVYEFLTPAKAPGPMLMAIRDRAGNRLIISRGGTTTRRIQNITSPNGRWVEFTYVDNPDTSVDLIAQIKDNSGRTVSYEYGENFHLTRVTDAAGGMTDYTYTPGQAVGQLETITDARRIPWSTNTYTNGRVSRQTFIDGTFYDFAYTLDGNGKVTETQVTNPRGYVRRVTFNAAGYPLTDTRAYGTTLAQTTTHVRDTANRVTSMTDALNRTTTYGYDPNTGNLLSVTRLYGTPDAVTTTFTYEPTFNQIATIAEPLPNHTTTYDYDGFGNLRTITNPLGKQISFTYNTSGQLLTVTTFAGTTTFDYEGPDLIRITDAAGNVTTRFTDALGRLVQATDPLGRKTRYTYDPLNQITQITDALGGLTRFGYDENGNLLTVTDARSNVTTYVYNDMDRVTSRRDPLYPVTPAETHVYDNNGNRRFFTDRESQVTEATYDALDRRTLVTYADTSTTGYTYDAGNRVREIVDSIGGTITFTYDGLDRLRTATTSLGTVTYTYDAGGRRTTMTVSGQTEVVYGYDDADQLRTITQGASVVSFDYDDAGRRMSHTLPNGIVTEYAYDAASRLTELTYKLGGNTLGTLTYDYNTAGERVTVGGTWARTVQPAAIATATYNAANQQATFGGQTLTYDLNGNLITDGTNTYTWNTRNQLATITGPTPAMFVYDGLGRRKQRTVTGATTDFLYDGFNVVQEQTAGTTTNVLTGLGIDERFRQSNATETRHLLEDALGSTIRLADDIGNPQTTYTYEPFGATTVTGGSTTNTYGYTGRENDGTALYYYRARYYHPALQRFISEDPLEFAGGVNVYAYALNRPISLTDPLGLFTLSVCVKISAAFGVAGGGGTCINGGYDRKDGFSMSLTGTAGVGGGGVGAAVGGSIAWSNAPSVAQLNGPFVSGGVGGGAGLVGSVSGFVGQGSRGTITGGEIFGGLGLKLPNTVAPPVAVEGGVTTTSTIVGVSRRGLVFFQP